MKILVACELIEGAVSDLRRIVPDVVYEPGLAGEALRNRLAGVGILVVGDQRVGREVIDRCESLQMIIRAAEGPGEVAIDDASVQGIFVTHCPSKYANAIAELLFGFLVALDRSLVEHANAIRAERWDRVGAGAANGLAGRTLGILGAGPSAQAVARLAQSFGMNVVAWWPNASNKSEPDPAIQLCNYPREVAEAAQAVCLLDVPPSEHAPIVDRSFLETLTPGSLIVHLGPSHAIDEAALIQVARERGLRVALDSFEGEPHGEQASFENPVAQIPGAIGSPQIGPLTRQAREAVAHEVVRIARGFLVGGEVHNCINLMERSPATWQLVLRVRDQVGVMASILDAIRADGVNAEEITSRVFIGAKAAWCSISLDERPSKEALNSIRALPDVMHLELRAVV